jgi:hypothetical protein
VKWHQGAAVLRQAIATGLIVALGACSPTVTPSPSVFATGPEASPVGSARTTGPTGPAATATAADVSAATAAVDAYTRLLVQGDWAAAYAALARASRDHWGSLANFTYERAAYFKSVAGRYTVVVPALAERGPITAWLPETDGTPIDLGHTVLVEVDYPALAGNNAGYGLYLVAPGAAGLLIFDVR